MSENIPKNNPLERRSEPRTILDKYHSVEINFGGPLPIYQFKLRDISSSGVCILVKEDSSILKHLKVGQILTMKYSSGDPSKPTELLKTKIKHITKAKQGRLKGHYLVGVFILEKSKNP